MVKKFNKKSSARTYIKKKAGSQRITKTKSGYSVANVKKKRRKKR